MDLKIFEDSIPDVGDTKDQLITKLRACLLALQSHVTSSEPAHQQLVDFHSQSMEQYKQIRLHLDRSSGELHDKLHQIASTLEDWAK